MQAYIEKRNDERVECEASIIVSLFSSQHRFESVAKTLNHSKGGMYFESDRQLRPGTSLIIRVNAKTHRIVPKVRRESLRMVTLAEVKWCRNLSGPSTAGYGVGIQYFHWDS